MSRADDHESYSVRAIARVHDTKIRRCRYTRKAARLGSSALTADLVRLSRFRALPQVHLTAENRSLPSIGVGTPATGMMERTSSCAVGVASLGWRQ